MLGKAEPLTAKVLGQFRTEGLEAWKEVSYLDEHPFFKPQKKLVLRNCGLISPDDIEEYIAIGGYAALAKVRSIAKVTEDQRGTVISLAGEFMFRTGDAELLPFARERLDTIAVVPGMEMAVGFSNTSSVITTLAEVRC